MNFEHWFNRLNSFILAFQFDWRFHNVICGNDMLYQSIGRTVISWINDDKQQQRQMYPAYCQYSDCCRNRGANLSAYRGKSQNIRQRADSRGAIRRVKLRFRNGTIFIWKRVASSPAKRTEVERTLGHARRTSQ